MCNDVVAANPTCADTDGAGADFNACGGGGGGVHTLELTKHPYNPALNGEYHSVGSFYRNDSPPRQFLPSANHHLFRRDDAANGITYLVYSYGIHAKATWYLSTNGLQSDMYDYEDKTSKDVGQVTQTSIGVGWVPYTTHHADAVGHYPVQAYSPQHILTGSFTSADTGGVLTNTCAGAVCEASDCCTGALSVVHCPMDYTSNH